MSGRRPAVALKAPDLRRFRDGGSGIDHVHVFDGPMPGPHVVVSAVVHGNEISGAIALAAFLDTAPQPARGRLTCIFANTAAFERFDPRYPYASRFVDEDMNRVWAAEVLDGPRDSTELRRARVLRPILETADTLLDLHSMQHESPPLILAGAHDKGRRFAERMGVPETVVLDAGHEAGVRLRDFGGFGRAEAPAVAVLAECGCHWAEATATVAFDTLAAFLRAADLLTPESLARLPDPVRRPPTTVRVTEAVTVRTERFEFVSDYRGMECIPKAGTLIAADGGRDIRTPYDACVLVMPSHRLRPGQTAVRLGRILLPEPMDAAAD